MKTLSNRARTTVITTAAVAALGVGVGTYSAVAADSPAGGAVVNPIAGRASSSDSSGYASQAPAAGMAGMPGMAGMNTGTAPASYAGAQKPWTARARTFQARLTGAQEIDTVGSAQGRATAILRLDPATGRVEYRDLRIEGVLGATGDAITKLHIHRGAAGVNGDVVIDFSATLAGGATSGNVTADPTLLAEVVKDPQAFYLNLHTTAFPKGAVRGQLQVLAAVRRPWSAQSRTIVARLSGAQEVDTVGSPAGRAKVLLRLDPATGRVAFRDLRVRNVLAGADDAVTKLHVHRGAKGVNGDVVIDFSATLAGGATRGEVTADPALVAEIAKNPGSFYVNLHTTSFPKGAVRGQLNGCMARW